MITFHFDKCAWAETLRTPRLRVRECPGCGSEVEVFSMDFETKCDKCGHVEFNRLEERVYWCARNCSYADECIGTELNYRIVNHDGRVDKAVYYFKKGFSCASAILHAYADDFGIDRQLSLQLPSLFSAGMGMAETCGVITGALMVIGVKYGKTKGHDFDTDKRNAERLRCFLREFQARNKYLKCKDMLGCDINEDGVFDQAWESGLILSVCPKLVRDASEIIEEMVMNDHSHTL
ncbi:MAG: C-GCAxxG-C-C family protein [Nitrospirota bacterium]